MPKLRIYLGELDVEITKEQKEALLSSNKAAFDDGGILFTELILTYNR